MSDRRVEIYRGIPENAVVIAPPLSEAELDFLVGERNLFSRKALGEAFTGNEPATAIWFGKLILGGNAMNEATDRFADRIRTGLAEHEQLAPAAETHMFPPN